jgi:N-acyl-D-aspartate/D-glutamate deacylase
VGWRAGSASPDHDSLQPACGSVYISCIGWGTVNAFLRWLRTGAFTTFGSQEHATRKMTSTVASRLSIQDRGVVRDGVFAEIVFFDAATIADQATYEAASGINGHSTRFVNGVAAVEDGNVVGDPVPPPPHRPAADGRGSQSAERRIPKRTPPVRNLPRCRWAQ